MRDTGAVGLRAERSETEPHEPVRFAAFAQFFKAYMGTASVVTASLPIPLAAFHLIPTYAAQEKFLSTYTSLKAYGYTHVYELGPLLRVGDTKIPFEGSEVGG